jgi:hypothetical protein
MAITVKRTRHSLLQATKHNPFASEWNTYTHTTLEIDGPTPAKFGNHIYNIIALEWNSYGTSQLLVADNGMRFYPKDLDEVEFIIGGQPTRLVLGQRKNI